MKLTIDLTYIKPGVRGIPRFCAIGLPFRLVQLVLVFDCRIDWTHHRTRPPESQYHVISQPQFYREHTALEFYHLAK